MFGRLIITYLILDKELDALDGSSSSLRDSGGDTTHCCSVLASCQVDHNTPAQLRLRWPLER